MLKTDRYLSEGESERILLNILYLEYLEYGMGGRKKITFFRKFAEGIVLI